VTSDFGVKKRRPDFAKYAILIGYFQSDFFFESFISRMLQHCDSRGTSTKTRVDSLDKTQTKQRTGKVNQTGL
jgi:hypothetical protein